MKLEYTGRGADAVIWSSEIDESTNLRVSNTCGQKYVYIYQDDDTIILDKEEAIALRNYLNQICPSL